MRPFLLSLALLLLALPLANAQEESYMLHMQGYQYIPAELTVPAGATVIAMNFPSGDPNATAEPHTVTSSTDRSLFHVTNIEPNAQPYPFQAPSVPGEYPFHCVYHPEMTGTLIVTESTQPTQTPAATSPDEQETPGAGLSLFVLAVMVALFMARR